jgi:hypothetical protein
MNINNYWNEKCFSFKFGGLNSLQLQNIIMPFHIKNYLVIQSGSLEYTGYKYILSCYTVQLRQTVALNGGASLKVNAPVRKPFYILRIFIFMLGFRLQSLRPN